MSLKSDKLAKRIQEIQQFLAARIEEDETYSEVSQELSKIAPSLAAGKLKIQIISSKLLSAQALQQFLGTSKVLTNICELQTDPLPSKPEQPELQPSATLTSQVAFTSNNGQRQTHYPLPTNQKVIIGRNPHICQILLPDDH
ncbi:MAG: hypothetical protein F6K41_42660, partial [Symploca sp. SIO3E6]|nr:hypothetical protein [Caldora sp. SIO3E6]